MEQAIQEKQEQSRAKAIRQYCCACLPFMAASWDAFLNVQEGEDCRCLKRVLMLCLLL